MVANANLTLKYSVDSAAGLGDRRQQRRADPERADQIYDKNLKVIASGTTDADGLLTLDLPRVSDLNQPRVAVLQSDTQFGIGVTNWSDGIEAWYFGAESRITTPNSTAPISTPTARFTARISRFISGASCASRTT